MNSRQLNIFTQCTFYDQIFVRGISDKKFCPSPVITALYLYTSTLDTSFCNDILTTFYVNQLILRSYKIKL